MAIKNTGIRKIRPTQPGEMLREDFMPDFGLTAATLAKALRVSRQTVNELLRERRAVSPAMALRLAKLFGNTPEFWLNAPQALDLWKTRNTHKTARLIVYNPFMLPEVMGPFSGLGVRQLPCPFTPSPYPSPPMGARGVIDAF